MTVSYRQPNSAQTAHSYKTTRVTVPWEYKHPHIPQTFYAKLDAPLNGKQAKRLQRTHEQAVEDFRLQIKLCEIDLKLLEDDDGEVLAYKKDEYASILEKQKRLVLGLRFHLNASFAFDYFANEDTDEICTDY